MKTTGARLAALAVGLPVMLATVGYSAFALVGDLARTSERHVVSYPWTGGTLTVHTSGYVTVEVGSSTQVGVTYTEHYDLKKPTITSSTAAGGLQLAAACPNGLFGDCEINYVLTVPSAATLDLHSGDGDIQLTGTSGAASLDSGDGAIALDDVSGTIVAHTGDGSVDGTKLRSPNVEATTGDGHVHLDWSVAPTTVDATSGDGSIDLVLPQGSGPYRTTARTGDGPVHDSSLSTDPNAAASISAETGDGSISIGYPNSN